MSALFPIEFGNDRRLAQLDALRPLMWRPRDVERLAEPDLLDLQPGARLADLGCGTGYLGRLLLPHLGNRGHVVGYDRSQRLVDVARERAQADRLGDRLHFVQADVTNLTDVSDAANDGALCQTLLMHVRHPDAVLAEMSRIVRPGGFVAAIEPDKLAGWVFTQDSVAARDVSQRLRTAAVSAFIAEGTRRQGAGDWRCGGALVPRFAEAGLRDVRCWMNPNVLHCHPPYDEAGEAYRRYLLQDLRGAFEDDDVARMSQLYRAGGGDPALWQAWLQGEVRAEQQRIAELEAGTFWGVASDCLVVTVGWVPTD